MDKIGEIGRANYRKGCSIKGTSRDLGVSRAAVRKVLRSGATEFVCKRRTQPRSTIDPWRSELEGMLSENASRQKPSERPLEHAGAGPAAKPGADRGPVAEAFRRARQCSRSP